MKVFGKKYNIYEIATKIENGERTTWMENALYAGFTPKEIENICEGGN